MRMTSFCSEAPLTPALARSKLPPVRPETRYAKSGDVHIAYQIVGEGPRDLVLVPGWASHVECFWEEPGFARFLGRLATFSRLIIFDKRGTGLSDRVPGIPTLEERMDDVRTVMDAAGSERAVLCGISEGGPMSALFAATYPERTASLVLYGAQAKFTPDQSYPWGWTLEQLDAFVATVTASWGQADSPTLALLAPSVADDLALRHWWARYERQSASPGAFAALFRMNAEIDVRPVLPTIRAPTLVLHREGDRCVTVDHGRYLAEHIPGAKYVELPGIDHLVIVGFDPILDEIEEFVTGVRPGPTWDRALATVLFTDIVGATEQTARLGDQRWRDLLDRHHALIRTELAFFRGREVKTLGDGFLATFDGPARAIRCACAIRDGLRPLGIEIRAGLHTGECELMGDDVGGIAVHIGARVAARAAPGEVLVSSTVKDLVAGSGLHFVDRGVHKLHGVPEEWRLFELALSAMPATSSSEAAAEAEPPPTAASSADVGVFRREGDVWTVTWAGRTVRLRDARGFAYLAVLLRHPDRELHATDVVRLAGGDEVGEGPRARPDGELATSPDLGHAGTILDARAHAAYRARLAELREELAEAEGLNDLGRVERCREEIAALVQQLAGAKRGRTAAAHGERARVAVTKGLKGALERIAASHPELGRHLTATVRRGYFCVYRPDPAHPVRWEG
jgi:pimeloyl-ACP methyl ester carboxylesterase/class 3 adenylate cyclase